MSEAWEKTTLGGVAEVIMGQSPPGDSYNSEGLGLPFMQGSAEFGRHYPKPVKWCSKPARVAEPGDLLLSVRAPVGDTNHADQRIAIGRGLSIIRGRRGDTITGFLRLALESGVAGLLARSGGGMFSSITAANLRGFELLLPPMHVQRRIVDLIGSLDGAVVAVERERSAALSLLSALLRRWHDELQPCRPLGSAFAPRSGPSWAAEDESETPRPGAVRVLKITNTRPDGRLDMSTQAYVDGLPSSTALLDDRSLILIRTNGNRARIGNVYRPSGEAMGCAVSAFQFSARCADVASRDFYYWWLRTPQEQAAMSEAASGTTGLGNLAAGWLKQREAPDPEPSMLPVFEEVAAVLDRLQGEVSESQSLRSILLTLLLSREIEIPDAYDVLLNEGVSL